MQDNPLFENEFELMNKKEKEKDAEDYCIRTFRDVVIKTDYYVLE